jgi:hypothetical protein
MRPPSEVTRAFPGGFDTVDRARLGPGAERPVLPESPRCEGEGPARLDEPDDPWPARRIALRREYGGHENQWRVLREDAARRADRE